MTKYLITILLALGLLTVVPTGMTRADQQGTISGQIQNDTQGGDPVGGLQVTLWVIQGGQQVDSKTATANDQGAFRFEGLDTSTGQTFVLQTSYKDVTYSQGPLQFEQGQTNLAATLPVYETTTDDTNIAVGQAHFFITVQDNNFSVAELYVFNNSGDRTYIGKEELNGQRWTSQFTLPSNGRNLALSDGSLGGRFLATANGFVDREPLWPGQTSVMFQYDLDCPGGTCSLVREINYPITSLNVLIPDIGVTLDSQDLAFQGTLAAQGQNYLNYVASNLVAGQQLQINLRPASSRSSTAQSKTVSNGVQALPWILLGVVAIGLILGYPFWKQHLLAKAGVDAKRK